MTKKQLEMLLGLIDEAVKVGHVFGTNTRLNGLIDALRRSVQP